MELGGVRRRWREGGTEGETKKREECRKREGDRNIVESEEGVIIREIVYVGGVGN